MSRSRRRRGRMTSMVVASACLVGSVSTVMTCGNADWSAPPRYDGAGYAVLAQALQSGRGYRAIDHPDRPRHTHFPPGYPLVLALAWRVLGKSATAAHVISTLFTLGACLAAWAWFRRLMASPVALILGLALAVNWLWARTGSAILSEPLYMLLSQLTILAFLGAGRRNTMGAGTLMVLSAVLAACLLTRHVAIGLALAVLLDLTVRRRWWQAMAIAALSVILVSPWLGWMAVMGSGGRTQAGLLVQGDLSLAQRVAYQLVFYVQRIPDQLIGPFVEVGTLYQRSTLIARIANLWAVLATAVIVGGWALAMRRPRRRLAGLVPLCTLGILVVWPYTEAGRFLIPLVPNLLVGAVEGLAGLARLFKRMGWFPPRQSRFRLWAACLVLAASVPYSAYMLGTGRARALKATDRDFDAACDWIAAHADRPGPILSRHPGEVFWQTGRQSLEVPGPNRPGDVVDTDAIERTIETYGVSYLLIDHDRYTKAPTSPLAHFVALHPDRVRKIWDRETEHSAIWIYEVRAL
jgi:Dolichyl-phosphate-mannose-protein mannosyltransferase